jgi:eukaryotic-like serine/threonine-protein kinase
MRPQVGQVINNKYRLLRVIGDGGMGSVYEARHEVLGTSVALKFLHSELSRRQGLVARFLQEARVSAQIQSPHVVRVTDVDQTPAGAFIVMEYLEGRTLQTLYEDLYHAGLRLAYADALEYAMQMLEGVEAAHKTGIVHRDLKPDNVMITLDAKGRAVIKLLDFGIAKLKVSGDYDRGLTRPGVIMGTPEYMAPEQAFSADAVDARADIFSLGVMIFEMLAGRRPVGGDDPQQIAASYLSDRIARLTDLAPEIDPELAAAVHRAMAARVGDRWQTVTELRDAMEPFAAAAKAPSALPPSVSLSSPGLARASLAGAASLQPPRAVPKTFPPDDGPPPRGHDVTTPADPPVMSGHDGHAPADATPLGGFGTNGSITGEASKFEAGVSDRPPAVDGHAATAPAAIVPPTRSAAPYVASPDAFAGSPRPAGTVDDGVQRSAAIGDATAFAAPLHLAVPELSPRPGGTAVGLEHGLPLDGTVPMPMGGTEAAFSAEAAVGPPPAPSPFAGRRPTQSGGKAARRRAASSLPVILLLAGAVSAAVVGGLYVAQRSANVDDHEDPPVTTAPLATVHSDPPPDEPGPPVPGPTTPRITPPRNPQPFKPAPRGSNQPVAPPSSSAPQPQRVPIIPSVLPLVIPSTLPFGFPFGPQEPPRSQPDTPPRGQVDPPPPRQPGPSRPRRPPRDQPPPPPPPDQPY